MDLYKIRQKLSLGIPITKLKLRVTDYARVSTEHEEQKKSLQNQQEHFQDYIKNNPNWIYVKGYVDDGITGTSDLKRDNFMRMIDDAKKGKFDLIITKEISRFSRNTLDSIKYTRKLLEYGVAVLFMNDNINTAMPDSELRLAIMSSMAQDEIRRLSERVKFGMNQAIKRGDILGNNKLYGYRKNPDTGNLEMILKEAKVVKKIFELYTIDKLSLCQISKILNTKKIPTGFGNKWCVTTISRMIENPKYKGYYCGKKTEILDYMTKKVKYLSKYEWTIYKDVNKIPPIVDEYLWNQANIRLETRKKKNKKVLNSKNKYLYSSKIFCLDHNCPFYRRVFRKKDQDATWVCSKYLKDGKKVCSTPNLREQELDVIFQDLIRKLDLKLDFIVKFLMDIYSKNCGENDIELQRKKIMEMKKIKLKKDKLLELNLQNILTTEEFVKKNQDLNKQLKEKQKQLNQIKNTKNFFSKDDLSKMIKNKILSLKTTEFIINELLNKIVVSKINNDKNNIKLDVYLKSFEHKNINDIQNYEFKRGYDTVATKRYKIKYQVNFIMKNPIK